MHVLERQEYLIHEELDMIILQRLRTGDYLPQVSLHQRIDCIDFFEALSGNRKLYRLQFVYVVVY